MVHRRSLVARDEFLRVVVLVARARAWEDVAPHWPAIRREVGRNEEVLRLRYRDGREGRRRAQKPRTRVLLAVLLKFGWLRYQHLSKFRDEPWAVDESWHLGPLLERCHKALAARVA